MTRGGIEALLIDLGARKLLEEFHVHDLKGLGKTRLDPDTHDERLPWH